MSVSSPAFWTDARVAALAAAPARFITRLVKSVSSPAFCNDARVATPAHEVMPRLVRSASSPAFWTDLYVTPASSRV
eukprot:118027-Prymnesium_polylepis.1